MKRLVVIAPVLCALLLMVAPSASAQGKPTRIPQGPFDVSFSAGQVCSFALEAKSVVQQEVETLWSNPDGTPNHAEVNGKLVVQFTNLDTGSNVTLNESGPGSIVFNPDGSLTFHDTGPTGLSLFPTDQPPGPATILNYGRTVLTVSPTGMVTILSMTGNTLDVCAMIA